MHHGCPLLELSLSSTGVDRAYRLTEVEFFIDRHLAAHESLLLTQLKAGYFLVVGWLLLLVLVDLLPGRLSKGADQPIDLLAGLVGHIELRLWVEIVVIGLLLQLLLLQVFVLLLLFQDTLCEAFCSL